MGEQTGARGTASVHNEGDWQAGDALTVGGAGTGEITIASGASVRAGTVVMGRDAGSANNRITEQF